jgi:PPE-repeat protein
MHFSVLPPEINSLRMFTGVGSGPMWVAAMAWEGLAAELGSSADSFSSVISGMAGQSWQGAASAAMTSIAIPYAGWLNTAAAQAAEAAAQAKTVVSAFEAAQAAMVHPLAVAANRNQFVQLVSSNLFGQNAPAIADTEADYEQMWAQDVSAMVGYHSGASAAVSALSSWQQTLQGLPGLGQAVTPAVSLPALNTGLGNNGV